jgi:ubiquinol-cytochrome c reductase cytochrome c1 subunit
MMLKLKSLILAATLALAGISSAYSAEAEGAKHEGGAAHTPHYPINKPHYMDWTFAGPLGHFDEQQLQRGLKVYTEVCSACHSMKKVAFRSLEALGYSPEQVKALAATYTITDGPNADGEMFERPGVASDYFPGPYPNVEASTAANNGAYPPDMSLLAKARAVERGFPTFIFDIFTMYQETGPDYIYSLLTGYTDDIPEGVEVPEGAHYNPYFINGPALAMAPPISDDVVAYDDGTKATTDQIARDVTAFLYWAAEPHLEQRKETGFKVMIFLAVFSVLVFLLKRRIFASVAH